VLYLVLPIQLGLIVFGKPFLTLWLGDPIYAEQCYPALVVLSATLSLVVAQSIAARILYGLGHLRVFARAALLEAFANVLLGVLLCPEFGLLGVALAVAIPNLVMCVWVIHHTARKIELNSISYLRAWAVPLVAIAIPLGIWLIPHWILSGWMELGVALLAGLLPYSLAIAFAELRKSWTLNLGARSVSAGRTTWRSIFSRPR